MVGFRLVPVLCCLIVYCESAPSIDWNSIETKLKNFRDKVVPVAQGACGVLNGIPPPNAYQPLFPPGSAFDPQQSSRRFPFQQQFPPSFYPTFTNENPHMGWRNFRPNTQFFPHSPSAFPQTPIRPQFPRNPPASRFPQASGFPRVPLFPHTPNFPRVPTYNPPNQNGIDSVTKSTEQPDLKITERPSTLPEIPPFIPPTDQNAGDTPTIICDSKNGTSVGGECEESNGESEQDDLNRDADQEHSEETPEEDDDNYVDAEIASNDIDFMA